MTIKPTVHSANGVSGHLLLQHHNGTFVFRVYNADKTFVDYDLVHCDLCVTIVDEDACFYSNEYGQNFLDHSPATLEL